MENEKKLKDIYPENRTSVLSDAFQKRWKKVVNKRPSDLTIGELAMCIRQQHFLDTLMPLAIEVLRVNPLAGKVYKGELLHSVALVTEYTYDMATDLQAILNHLNIQECMDHLSSDIEIHQFSESVRFIKAKTKDII